MWKQFKDWWSADGAAHQLLGLDDRLLADMGLERAGLRKRVMGRTDRQNAEGKIDATGPGLATCNCP